MECPFCGWKTEGGERDTYEMMLHVETMHSEDESPFVVKDDAGKGRDSSPSPSAAKTEEPLYAECEVEGCGELILLDQLDYHLELHSDETGEQPNSHEKSKASSSAPFPSASSSNRDREHHHHHRSSRDHEATAHQSKAVSFWKNLFRMPVSSPSAQRVAKRCSDSNSGRAETSRLKRLGKSDLGRYAHEEQMPAWLETMLRRDGQAVRSKGVVSILAWLLEQSPISKYSYLCHPCVQHVSKVKGEGGFCGYRNIQMLCSYVIHNRVQGYEHLGNDIPSIFQIQDFIEEAWDKGFNSSGRIETGGIKRTRKYIGTPEAIAMFRLLKFPCEAQGFKHDEPKAAETLLLDYVEQYFKSGLPFPNPLQYTQPQQHVQVTDLAPLYFQHRGHSLTIIGFEKLYNGNRQLIVFDPYFHDASSITKLVGKNKNLPPHHPSPDSALRIYRRGTKYLRPYREFEVVK
ncbi:peptidase family C78-domain-containing protein [Podospora fimiseda]|uniref:Peptidase family C78-domain-containing protein n=1 Tax=Podospora fimiseda TaxID=252190 RepID=A0AAN7BUU8_9PEZI|nr:peptidase family C78-domain-containing protein [Podospora fimiseda]